MTSIRKFVYAALLAATALTCAPTLASGQEAARGTFTLAHDVHFGNARLVAGTYAFSYDPTSVTPMLNLSKTTGARARYMVLVPSTGDSRPSDVSRLLLEQTPEGSYVSALQLPQLGMTLFFTVPSHPADKERQMAKAVTAASAAK